MSLNEQQAGRDAESYDNERHEGRYAAGGDRAAWFPVEPSSAEPLHPDSQAALDVAMAQIERAFGTWDRKLGRNVRVAPAHRVAA